MWVVGELRAGGDPAAQRVTWGAAGGARPHWGLISHLKDLGVCPGAMGKSLKAMWGGSSVTRPCFYFEKVIWLQCSWRMELDMNWRRSQSRAEIMRRIQGLLSL